MKPHWLLPFALCLAQPAAAQESSSEGTPLFASHDTLDVTLSGPIRQIARKAENSTDSHPATLEADGETHAIDVSARGKSRRQRENCRFPPIRIAFREKPGEQSLFHRQGRIKLVTHCRDRDASEQTVLREYAAYRLYNLVTPESLRVRMVRVRYIDDGKLVAHRLGFLIEDADDAARRLGAKEVDTGDIAVRQLDQQAAARFALFQYMIGNTDWSLVLGPEGADCCHNTKLLGSTKDASANLTPVPYDFDNAGLVDAPYAAPNERLRTYSVTTRVYRGFCRFNTLLEPEMSRMISLRPAFEREIAATPYAEDKTKTAMSRYLGEFFDEISSPETVAKKLTGKCR